MDIHKPKAAHSWREFLVEIGTITCGILIALSLEQAVEQAHAHHETEVLERALKVEVTRALGEALQQSSFFYCIRAQTAAAAERLQRSGDWPGAEPLRPGKPGDAAGHVLFAARVAPDATRVPDGAPAAPTGYSPGPGVPLVIPAPRSTLIDRTWRTAASTPGLSHMDSVRRDRFALIYYDMAELENAIDDQSAARTELSALAYPQTLTPEERRRTIAVLSRMDADGRKIYSLTGQLIGTALRNGIQPDAEDLRGRIAVLRETYGDCIVPFVMGERVRHWTEKFEADRRRFGGEF